MVCTTASSKYVSVQEAAIRARAKQANLETKKANEILQSFKRLDAQRELEADAAIEGGLCCAVLCCAVLCCAVLCCAVLCCAVLCCAVLCFAMLCCPVPCCAVVDALLYSVEFES